MSLDRITKKVVLEETIPQVLLPEYSTTVGHTEEEDTPSYTTDNLTTEYNQEISAWNDLLDSATTSLNSYTSNASQLVSDITGTTSITPKILQDWLNTGNSIWPDAVISYEEEHWDNGTSILGMLYGTILEVKNELEGSLTSIANSVSTPSLPKEVYKTAQSQINNAQTLRSRIDAATKKAEKEMPECYIRKAARILQKTYKKSSSGVSYSTSQASKKDFVNIITSIRLILRYQLIEDKINWKNTRKNVLNRFIQVLSTNLLMKSAIYVGKLEEKINQPIYDLISKSIELTDEGGCEAFDELISIVIGETQKLKLDYVSKIYELEKEINNKYGLRSNLVDMASHNVTMNKHLATLDIILDSLETVLSSGNLSQEMVNYVKGKVVK